MINQLQAKVTGLSKIVDDYKILMSELQNECPEIYDICESLNLRYLINFDDCTDDCNKEISDDEVAESEVMLSDYDEDKDNNFEDAEAIDT